MKRRLLTILLVPVLLVAILMPLVSTKTVSAASSCKSGYDSSKLTNVAGVQLVVCLENGGNQLSNSQGYTVKVTQTIDNAGATGTKNVTYATKYGGGYYYTTEGIQDIDDGSDCQNNPTYSLTVSVSKGSTTYPSKTVDLCGVHTGDYYTSVSVAPNQQSGCFAVTDATYTSDAGGPNIAYTHAATAVLAQQGATTKQLTFDDSGNIAKICGIPVGNYTFKASYNPTDPSVGPLDRVIQVNGTIKAGQTWTINKPVGKEGTAPAAPVAATGNDGSGSGNDDTCENGFSLAWILCSVISGTASLITGLYTDIINPILNQPQSSDLLDTNQPYYKVWSNFRIYGDIFLVIALLVVVFGESIGGGIIDAYTAKKILPRLLVAAILINLSIYLVAIALDVTDILGKGIYSLFVLPFNSGSLSGFRLHLDAGGTLLTTLGAGGLLVGVAVTSGFLHFLFVTVLGSAALILITVMVTLVLRVALILGLVFVSPIAFALYVLPNTEQYFRRWWDLLFRALLVYPIVGALFALANITSYTLGNLPLSGISQSFAQVLGLFGMFAPLVLVPFAFRLSGGAIGAIHNAANSRIAQPGLQGLAGVRARRRQTLHERRMNAEDRLGTGRTGALYRGVSTFGTRDGWTPTRGGRERFRQYNVGQIAKATDKRLEEGGSRAFNDDDASAAARSATSAADFENIYSRTLMDRDGVDEATARTRARSARGRTEAAMGIRMGSDNMRLAAQKFRIAATNTAYGAGAAGLEQMQTEVQEMVRSGLITSHDAAGWMKSNRGRADYSANAYGATVDFLEGHDQNGNVVTASDQLRGAFQGADPRDVLGGHQRTVEGFAMEAGDSLSHALGSGDQYQIDNAMADVANIHSTLSSVSPNKAVEFERTVLSQPSGRTGRRQVVDADGNPVMNPVVDGAGNAVMRRTGRVDAAGEQILEPAMEPVMEDYDMTVRQYIDELRSDERNHPAFHDRSREYASARQAAGAAAAGAAAAPPPEEGS